MTHPAFELLRRHRIDSLKLELQQYQHRKTGAKHLHLVADDNNNAFLLAFLTVPQDSSGVAHILEHTALCGSQRFPVRDPFFMMTRRSLNTFMNAFTSNDWTAYPFASQNKKDFNNLLDVYLDAALFPLLDELDFAQEGHRIEFTETTNPDSELVYKGVVFNEMKGAMSSPARKLGQDLQTALFPTLTYHYNSGGEPSEIPKLTHAQLKAFHGRHYHPSNAVFMTYGDIPAVEHQTRFEDNALKQFDKLDIDLRVADEKRFTAPLSINTQYALDGEDPSSKTYILLGWLLGPNTDPRAVLEAQILADVLLDNSSSPLLHALETSPLGSAPAPICGLDDDTREMVFAAGLEGSKPEHAQAVEDLILSVIEEVARNGVPQSQLDAVLHQIELSQREITGDGFPYGLQLILEALTPAIHGGDPIAALDQDALLAQLREDSKNPDFIKSLAQELLLDNQHRVRLVMTPDPELNERETQAEAEQLAVLQTTLKASDKTRIIELSQALEQRQNTVDDPEVLPRVTLADVAPELKIVQGESRSVAAELPATWYAQATNGMVYQQLIVDLPQLEPALLDYLPLYCLCLCEVGVNGDDYMTIQAKQAALTGGLGAGYAIRGQIDDAQQIQSVITLAGKALARNQAALTELLEQTFTEARFDELPRLRELVAQCRAGREQRITGSGHALAMTAAGAALSPTLALSQRWDGLAGLKALQALDDSLDDETALAAMADKLKQVGACLQTAPRQLLLVSEAEQQAALSEALSHTWPQAPQTTTITPFTFGNGASGDDSRNHGWSTSTQVSFCAKAYPTVALNHADAPALQVLGNFIRNGYLHRALREQGGAYGGGAGYNGDSGTFRFFSYRDPRFAETFADFDQSLDWLHSHKHAAREVEEAILGVIAAIDKPGSPAGEAITAFYAELFGRTPAFRRGFRQRILELTIDDLKRVAGTYLQPESAHCAAISSAEILQQQGWQSTAV